MHDEGRHHADAKYKRVMPGIVESMVAGMEPIKKHKWMLPQVILHTMLKKLFRFISKTSQQSVTSVRLRLTVDSN